MMIRSWLKNLFNLFRSIINFGSPCEGARDVDEICRTLKLLQLDVTDPESVPAACIYLADPHNLPLPASDRLNNDECQKNINEYYCFHDEINTKQNNSSDKKKLEHKRRRLSDMSISSDDSEFEEALQNYFRNSPKPDTDRKIWQNGDDSLEQCNSSYVSCISVTSTPTNSNTDENSALDHQQVACGSDTTHSLITIRRKRRKTDHNDESSPVEQFHGNSLVASTPLSSKSDTGRWRRFAMLNSATKTKVRQSKQRALRALNLSASSSADSSGLANNSKNETPKREQGAIAKHIARIRTSVKNGPNEETSPPANDKTRYHSMHSSFDNSNINKSSSSVVTL